MPKHDQEMKISEARQVRENTERLRPSPPAVLSRSFLLKLVLRTLVAVFPACVLRPFC